MNNFLLSIVVPVYNEEEVVRSCYNVVDKVMRYDSIRYEIIFVNDGSVDRSWEEIFKLSQTYNNVRGFSFSRNFGKEAAIIAGLEYAKGDCVIVMDCDLQHPPEYIPQMVSLWEQGVEVVQGIKNKRQKETIISKISAKAFYKLLEKISGMDLENSSDFQLLDRSVVDELKKMPERNMFFRALSTWVGYRREPIYFEVAERFSGKTKFNGMKLIKLAIDSLVSFSGKPLQLITCVGFLFLIISVVLSVQTMVVKLIGRSESGFPTVIILLLAIGSMLMISQGLIGVYIEKIYEELKSRPRYLISKKT